MTDRQRGDERRRSHLRRLIPLLAVVALMLTACSSTLPQSSLNPKSTEAEQIDQLWKFVLLAATGVFIIVQAVLVIAIIRFRSRKGDDREPKQTHGNMRLEITWTILPAVVLAVLAVPTFRTLFELRSVASGADVLVVHVTAHQWWWEFEYPAYANADGRTVRTANELHLPAGVTADLQLTSVDVIHSFWVPALAGKRDAVPGQIQHLKITPDSGLDEVIPGQCAEYCWLGHADMRFKVHVETEEEFQAWIDQQLIAATVPSEDTSAGAGYQTFSNICTACHTAYVSGPDGVEEIGTRLAPDLTHFGSRETMAGSIMTNTPEHLAQWIDDPSALKAMDPDLNDLTKQRILGMPDYNLDQQAIADLVSLLEGWK